MPPETASEREDRISKKIEERLEIKALLEKTLDRMVEIRAAQKLQSEMNLTNALNMQALTLKIEAIEKDIESLESASKGGGGIVSSGVSGAGGAGLIYAAIEAIKKLTG